MNDTCRMMRACSTKYYMSKKLDDLVSEYKQATNIPTRNKLVATIFLKVYAMIIKIQDKFYTLTNEQKVETALTELVEALNVYNIDKNVKFSTFFYRHLTNQMISLLSSEHCIKRAVFQNLVNNNDDQMEFFVNSAPAKDEETTDGYFLDNLYSSMYLSQEEKDFCKCILKGYIHNKDIARVLQESGINVKDMQKGKKQKFTKKEQKILNSGGIFGKNTILGLMNKQECSCSTNPIHNSEEDRELIELKDKKQQLKYLRNIKKSIKNKFEKYGRAIFG